MKAIDIIHAEHRALGAVVQALRFVLDSIRAGSAKPEADSLSAASTASPGCFTRSRPGRPAGCRAGT